MFNKTTIIFLLSLLFSCSPKNTAWYMGEDSNKDGVRDDIESWITHEYKGRPKLMNGLMYLAKYDPARCDYKFHLKCLDEVTNDGLLLQIKLFEKIIDTEERKLAFDKRVVHCPIKDDRYINRKCDF